MKGEKFFMQEPIYTKKNRFGYGAFASRNIKKGEKICVMAGKKIKPESLHDLVKSGRNLLVDPLQVNDDAFINMKKPYVLINHSCSPNAGLKNGTSLFAIKNIKKDDEILYDYSSSWLEGFECGCGNRNCRKFISDFFSLPKPVQAKYVKMGIVPDFVRKKFRKKYSA
jgi:SET domain-containing protein